MDKIRGRAIKRRCISQILVNGRLSTLKRKLREEREREREREYTWIGFEISEDALRFSSGGIEGGSSFGDQGRRRRRIH